MWCCCPILLKESKNSSIYQQKDTVKKVIHCKKMYEKELAALQKLTHPNIVSIDRINRNSFIMKYYPRGDMFFYIQNGLPEYVARHYAKQLIEALIYCHGCGISHRDVKPDNLLLSDDWNIILCDFGLSTMKEIEDTYCGTAEYAPPEVFANIPYNPKLADTWSYGVTVYAMFMGILPWNGWSGSKSGKEFVRTCLHKDRPYLYEMSEHPWLKNAEVASYMSKIEIY